MGETIKYLKEGRVATITLNRPQKFNAMNTKLINNLIVALERADGDPDIGVVLLKGAGKAWCAGGDIDELLLLSKGNAGERRAYLTKFKGMIDKVRRISKPIIASVHGACIGGGNELNIACDLTIASEKAKFGQAGTRVGSIPVFGIPQTLQILVGEKRAREITYFCRLYSAIEAVAMGWINKVVPEEDLEKETMRWAEEILDKSPTAITIGKKMHNVYYDLLSSSAETGIELLVLFWGTEEAKEGMLAFKEKRSPIFNH